MQTPGTSVVTYVFSNAEHCNYTMCLSGVLLLTSFTHLTLSLFEQAERSWYDAQASRPKLALWHSARERAVWMRDMSAAQVSHSAAELAYLAAVLSDK